MNQFCIATPVVDNAFAMVAKVQGLPDGVLPGAEMRNSVVVFSPQGMGPHVFQKVITPVYIYIYEVQVHIKF